ncbi:dTDP-4-dehydrorhamnose reductase [Flavobacteriaceae bacterium]|jgi:dTDP-4-dehydrorhamnose reductase|nr:dTDP-4-dehydrorhamnose reductase [Flavobacteriaceae bacterium]
MMNVLVTGSNGQLGSCIKDIENQYEGLNFIYTDYQELDVCNLNDVEGFFKTKPKIDYCINCAAYTAVDKAETDVEKAFEINAQGAKNLALVCNEQGAILIHISTDFVFDGEKKEPYTETDVPKPISVYGSSKLKGEVAIQKTLKTHFIIRTSWLYSEHGANFMKTMLRLAETRDEVSVVSDQIGSPTYAGDLALLLLEIVNSNTKSFGLYHYSNEGQTSWYGFAKAIFESCKNSVRVTPISSSQYPTAATRPKHSVLDTARAKKVFNSIPYKWEISLKKAIENR